MSSVDARSATTAQEQPIDKVMNILGDKPCGPHGWYKARCPGHNGRDDDSLSFRETWNGGVVFKCHSRGCSREAVLMGMGLSEEDVTPDTGRPPSLRKPEPALDLISLAADKLLPWQLLFNLGIMDEYSYKGKLVVRIPYYTADGREHGKVRVRLGLTGHDARWDGDDSPLIPYGLNKLDMARTTGYLLIGEGESDAWTCWLHGLPYLGVPGANNTSCLRDVDLKGIARVFIIQEPDAAGKQFSKSVLQQLGKTRYKGKMYVLPFETLTGEKDPNALHQLLARQGKLKMFKEVLSRAIEQVTKESQPIERPSLSSRLCDLQEEVLPETKWAIPDILPEGSTLLVGKPKLGKSWLLFSMLNAISRGTVVLGNMPVQQGEVLYISLEDNKKRLQKRANLVMQQLRASEDFHYATSWRRINEGGLEDLEEWIQEHPRVRLIGIDTWAHFKPRKSGQRPLYDEDYDAIMPLTQLAAKYGVSIVVVHHFRKTESEDPLDMISGSTAMSGAVDSFLLLYRKRGETDARLYITGRDIEEEQELPLTFNSSCASWTIQDNTDDKPSTTPERQAILDVLATAPQGLPARDIASRLNKNINTTRNLLVSLRKEGKVLLINNMYRLKSGASSEASQHSKPGEDTGEGEYPGAMTSVGAGAVEQGGGDPTQNVVESSDETGDYAHYGDYANKTLSVQEAPKKMCCAPQHTRLLAVKSDASGDYCARCWQERRFHQGIVHKYGVQKNWPEFYYGTGTIPAGKEHWLHFLGTAGARLVQIVSDKVRREVSD